MLAADAAEQAVARGDAARRAPRRARRRQGHDARRRPPHDARARTPSSTGCPTATPTSSTALRRAGAVLIGQTTTPEFAHTLQTDSPLWGVTRNPHDPSRTPGGSSGGSGAAVAVGLRAAGRGQRHGRLGAHPGGVVRRRRAQARPRPDPDGRPARACSTRSPTTARSPAAPTTPGCSSPPRRAPTTPTSCPCPGRSTCRDRSTATSPGMRLGLSVDLGCWAVDPEIAAAVTAAAARLEAAGAMVDVVDPGFTAADEAAWGVLWAVFMAAYYGDLARGARRAHGPRRRPPDHARAAGQRRRPQAARDPPHRPVAPPGRRSSPTTTRCCARRWPCRRGRRRWPTARRSRRPTTPATTPPT